MCFIFYIMKVYRWQVTRTRENIPSLSLFSLYKAWEDSNHYDQQGLVHSSPFKGQFLRWKWVKFSLLGGEEKQTFQQIGFPLYTKFITLFIWCHYCRDSEKLLYYYNICWVPFTTCFSASMPVEYVRNLNETRKIS